MEPPEEGEYYLRERDISSTAHAQIKQFQKFTVSKDEDGWLVGRIKELGIVTQGKDFRELVMNLRECIELVKEEVYQNDGVFPKAKPVK